MLRLTKRVCDASKPTERQYIVWDTELPRFGLRVRETGGRVFMIQYRAAGRTRVVTIGRHGVLTVDQARSEARKLLGDVERGGDPASRRDQGRDAITVRELAERWLVQHVVPKLKAKTLTENRRLLERIVLPTLGRRRTVDVARADCSKLHALLAETRVQANRVLGLVSALFGFAEGQGVAAGELFTYAPLRLHAARNRGLAYSGEAARAGDDVETSIISGERTR